MTLKERIKELLTDVMLVEVDIDEVVRLTMNDARLQDVLTIWETDLSDYSRLEFNHVIEVMHSVVFAWGQKNKPAAVWLVNFAPECKTLTGKALETFIDNFIEKQHEYIVQQLKTT